MAAKKAKAKPVKDGIGVPGFVRIPPSEIDAVPTKRHATREWKSAERNLEFRVLFGSFMARVSKLFGDATLWNDDTIVFALRHEATNDIVVAEAFFDADGEGDEKRPPRFSWPSTSQSGAQLVDEIERAMNAVTDARAGWATATGLSEGIVKKGVSSAR